MPASHCCPRCLVKKDHMKYLPWREGNEEVKEAVSRLRVYCRPGCESGCRCTHKDCAKSLVTCMWDKFKPDDHGGVNPAADDMIRRTPKSGIFVKKIY